MKRKPNREAAWFLIGLLTGSLITAGAMAIIEVYPP